MSYDGQFLYPPRPVTLITPDQIEFFQERGYKTQIKMNGECAVLALGPDGEKKLYNRHDAWLHWAMPKEVEAQLREKLSKNSWTVFVAELLNAKVAKLRGGLRDNLYLHDVLVHNGSSLVGYKYKDRHSLLQRTVTPNGEVGIATNTDDGQLVWRHIVKMHDRMPEVEGIVMKNPNAVLNPCTKESSNSMHMVKCRIATKNYSH